MQTTLDNWRRNRTATRRDLEEAQLAQVYDLRVHHGAQARKQNPSSVTLDMRFMPPNSLNEMLKREARRAAAASENEPAKLVSQQARDLRELVFQMSRADGIDKHTKYAANLKHGPSVDPKAVQARPSKLELLKGNPAFAGVGTSNSGQSRKSHRGSLKNKSSPASSPSRHATLASPSRQASQKELMSPDSTRLSQGPGELSFGLHAEDDEDYAMELLTKVCGRAHKDQKSIRKEFAKDPSPDGTALAMHDPDAMSRRMRMIITLREEIMEAYSMVDMEDEMPGNVAEE